MGDKNNQSSSAPDEAAPAAVSTGGDASSVSDNAPTAAATISDPPPLDRTRAINYDDDDDVKISVTDNAANATNTANTANAFVVAAMVEPSLASPLPPSTIAASSTTSTIAMPVEAVPDPAGAASVHDPAGAAAVPDPAGAAAAAPKTDNVNTSQNQQEQGIVISESKTLVENEDTVLTGITSTITSPITSTIAGIGVVAAAHTPPPTATTTTTTASTETSKSEVLPDKEEMAVLNSESVGNDGSSSSSSSSWKEGKALIPQLQEPEEPTAAAAAAANCDHTETIPHTNIANDAPCDEQADDATSTVNAEEDDDGDDGRDATMTKMSRQGKLDDNGVVVVDDGVTNKGTAGEVSSPRRSEHQQLQQSKKSDGTRGKGMSIKKSYPVEKKKPVKDSNDVTDAVPSPPQHILDRPGPADVLYGTGIAIYHHRGNRRMRMIVARTLKHFSNATTIEQKDVVITTAIQKITKVGARFLKRHKEQKGWIECDNTEIRTMVSDAFRSPKDLDKGENKNTNGLPSKKEATDPSREKTFKLIESLTPSSTTLERQQLSGDTSMKRSKGSKDGSVKYSSDSQMSLPGPASVDTIDNVRRGEKNENDSTQSAHELLAAANNLGRTLYPPIPVGLVGTGEGQNRLPANTHGALYPGGLPAVGTRSNGIFVGPPMPMDVVVGREALLYNQEGNVHLQNIVRANIGRDIIPPEVKHIMSRAILIRMNLLGTRFCIKETLTQGIWYQLSDLEAQDVIYRGLCEEENRIQAILGPSKDNVFESTSASNSMALLHLHPDLTQRMLSADSSSPLMHHQTISDSFEGPRRKRLAGNSSDGTSSAKKKYKKRLKKLMEDATTSQVNNDNLEHDSRTQEPSNSSSATPSSSDDEEKNLLLYETDIAIGPYDVILGRGRGSFNHPGNQNLIHVFRANKVRYGNASKLQKTKIAKEIVDGIQKRGGRFLKRRYDDKWEIIANRDAYRKVCHGIRDLRESEKHFVDYIRPVDSDDRKMIMEMDQDDKSPFRPRKNQGVSTSETTRSVEMKEVSSSRLLERATSKRGQPRKEAASTGDKRADDEDTDDDSADDGSNGAEDESDNDDDLDGDDKDGSGDVDLDGKSANIATKRKTESGVIERQDREANKKVSTSREGVIPCPEDVVCGRGKALNRHPGNQRMHEIVKKYKYRYRDARSQDEKAKIAQKVFAAIKSNGGRLLRSNNDGSWYELEYKVGLKKVYHSIRDSLYNDDGKRFKRCDEDDNSDNGNVDVDIGYTEREDYKPGKDPRNVPSKNDEGAEKSGGTSSTPTPTTTTTLPTSKEDGTVMDSGAYFNELGLENISDPMLRARLAQGMSDPIIQAQMLADEIRRRHGVGGGQGGPMLPPPGMSNVRGAAVAQFEMHRLSRMRSLAGGNGNPGGGPLGPGGYGMSRGATQPAAGMRQLSLMRGTHLGGYRPPPSPFVAELNTNNPTEEELRRMIFSRYGV